VARSRFSNTRNYLQVLLCRSDSIFVSCHVVQTFLLGRKTWEGRLMGVLCSVKATTSTVTNDTEVKDPSWSTSSICVLIGPFGGCMLIQLLCANFGAELLMFGCHFR